MTRRRVEGFGSKPVLLLLHGAGSSAAIFRIQTHFLAKALSPYFDLVYVDAPVRSAPGPGILPYFEGMEGYYRWFGAGIEKTLAMSSKSAAEATSQKEDSGLLSPPGNNGSQTLRPQHADGKYKRGSSARPRSFGRASSSSGAAISAAASLGLNLLSSSGRQDGLSRGLMSLLDICNQTIPSQLEMQGVRSRDVVGVIGFSQGALAALGMLGVEMAIGSPAWSNLRFCVAMGAATGGGAAQSAVAGLMSAANLLGSNKSSREAGQQDASSFPGHTVHVIGRRDPWVKDSRQIAGMCHPQRTRVVEFEGGHWVPREQEDISRVVDLILEVELDSRRRGADDSSSSSEDEAEVEVLTRRRESLAIGV